MSIIKPLGIPKIKALGLNNTDGVENPQQKNLKITFLEAKLKGLSVKLMFEVDAKNLKEKYGFIRIFKTQNDIFHDNYFDYKEIDPKGRKIIDIDILLPLALNEKNPKYNILIKVDDMSSTSTFHLNIQDVVSKGRDNKLSVVDLMRMGIPREKSQKYINVLNSTFENYNITTDLRQICFFGQVLAETDAFTLITETGKSDADYGGFKGRGSMQLTGRENYVAYEEEIRKKIPNIDFTSSTASKDKINDLPYYIDSGGWFWGSLIKLNDDADRHDFIYIAYIVNGGFNGFDKRIKYHNKAAEVINKDHKVEKFDFRKSYCYNNIKSSFAWGLWHDMDKFKNEVKNDKNEALIGYNRFLQLYQQVGPTGIPKDGYYGYDRNKIVSFVTSRINSLK